MGPGFKLIPVNDKYARFIIITCLNLISQNTAQKLLQKIIKKILLSSSTFSFEESLAAFTSNQNFTDKNF